MSCLLVGAEVLKRKEGKDEGKRLGLKWDKRGTDCGVSVGAANTRKRVRCWS
jgi:hypothetical protein